jgi:hypothetical protein
MKTSSLLCLVLALAGCATKSRYANDPRARCVGPDYLESIDRHPPTKDTEYFNPVLVVKGGGYVAMTPVGSSDPKLEGLLTVRPEAAPAVKESQGKGWRKLESKGIPFNCPE